MSKQGPINPDIQRQTIEALLTEPGAAVEKCLKPEFLHLAPPLHSARDEVGSPINTSIGLLVYNVHIYYM